MTSCASAAAPAAAPGEAQPPIFPPRDRHARSIYDALVKFQRVSSRKVAGAATELRLTSATSSFARAIAHDYAERLGLLHATERREGSRPCVVVRAPPWPERASDPSAEGRPAKRARGAGGPTAAQGSSAGGKKIAAKPYAQELNALAKRATELTRGPAVASGAAADGGAADAPASPVAARDANDGASGGGNVGRGGETLNAIVDQALGILDETISRGVTLSAQSCAVIVHLCTLAARPADAVRAFELSLGAAAGGADTAARAASAPHATEQRGGAPVPPGARAPAAEPPASDLAELAAPPAAAAAPANAPRPAASSGRGLGGGGEGGGGGVPAALRDESVCSMAIRSYCELGRLAEAHALLERMRASGVKTRVRSYVPLLSAHCAAAAQLLPGPGAPSVAEGAPGVAHGATSGGNNGARTPADGELALAMQMLAHMDELELAPTEADLLPLVTSAARVGSWVRALEALRAFEERFAQLDEVTLNALGAALARVHAASAGAAPELRVFRSAAARDGRLLEGGWRLRQVDISPAQRATLRLAASQLIQRRRESFSAFQAWLDAQPPYDYVIDAANVGYYGNNATKSSPHGHAVDASFPADGGGRRPGKQAAISFRQVIAMIEKLRSTGARTLTCLHEKYLKRCREAHPEEAAVFERLQREGLLYPTPHGSNDDHYWLYAAVAGKCAERCRVISNDEMRDHHYDMLAPRFFARWKECHVVQYGMRHHARGADGAAPQIDVWLRHPPPYSSVVQAHTDACWFFPSRTSREWLCAVDARLEPPGNHAAADGVAAAVGPPAETSEGASA